MKKKILIPLLILTTAVVISGCGGGGNTTTTQDVPNAEGGNNNAGSSKEDMGQLPTANTDENDTNNILNLQAIQYDDISSDLTNLKICTDTACWTVLDSKNQSKSAAAGVKTKKLTKQTSLADIGSFDLNGVDGEIKSVEYIYNAKEGSMNLSTSVRSDQELQKDIYFEMKENISAPFSSISLEGGRNGIFIPNENFKKEFVNGVIVEAEQGSTDQMAHMYISSTGKTLDDNIEVNSYLLDFYEIAPNLDDISYVENKFPKEFIKDVQIYIPLIMRVNDLQYIKDNYILIVNATNKEFDIVERNSQYYILFASKSSSLEILVFDKQNYGGL